MLKGLASVAICVGLLLEMGQMLPPPSGYQRLKKTTFMQFACLWAKKSRKNG